MPSTPPVLLALDNDDAGRKATVRLMKEHPGTFTSSDYGSCSAKDPGDMTDGEIAEMSSRHTRVQAPGPD